MAKRTWEYAVSMPTHGVIGYVCAENKESAKRKGTVLANRTYPNLRHKDRAELHVRRLKGKCKSEREQMSSRQRRLWWLTHYG